MRSLLGICACVAALLAFTANAWATGEFEPNDTRDTASGPLAGGTDYTATFETNNDVDWYLFYLRSYSQMDISATLVSGCDSAAIELLDKDGKELQYFYSGDVNGETRHLMTTLAAGRYYFEVHRTGCVGDSYRLRIDPAAAVTANRECGEAIVAKESIGPQLAKVGGELTKVNEKLVKPNEQVAGDEAGLAALKGEWERFLLKWKAAVRHLARRRGMPGYMRRARKRSLLSAKRRKSLELRSKRTTLEKKLEAAKAAQAKVLEQKAGLEALQAQAKSTQSQAEAQIAAHC